MSYEFTKSLSFSWDKKYAELILDVGVRFQKGDKLAINCESINWHFAKVLSEVAYEKGAQFVDINAGNNSAVKVRLDNSDKETLGYIPEFKKATYDQYAAENWSMISVFGPENPEVFKGVDQAKNAIVQKVSREIRDDLRKKVVAHQLSWNVCSYPTVAWARQVFPEIADENEAIAAFEKLFVGILRLDKEDSKASWKNDAKLLNERAKNITADNFKALEFKSPVTDLYVELAEVSPWAGGAKGEDGFLPNIPTEEVFTSPDWRKTTGKVQVTRPVELLGSHVKGAYFEFKDGKVVDYKAEEGKDLLDAFFDIDPRAQYLGEVALVGKESPIYQSGKIFHSILHDENAACHIALGSAYPLGVSSKGYTEKELIDLGLNCSILHTDFMIGSDDLDVFGITQDGKKVPVMQQGLFVEKYR